MQKSIRIIKKQNVHVYFIHFDVKSSKYVIILFQMYCRILAENVFSTLTIYV